jgi:hypothetical protein
VAIYDHLPLRRLEGALERRQYGFGRVVQRNAQQHGAGLQHRIETIVAAQQAKPKVADIDPALILKVLTTGGIAEETWAALGLTLLSDEDNKSVVLFANDAELTEFKRRVEEYQKQPPEGQKHPAYAALVGAIESVAELSGADRIGPVLRDEGKTGPQDFADGTIEILDVELWQPSAELVLSFATRIEAVLQANNGELINEYRGTTMTLLRVRANGTAIRALLEQSEVFRVDRPPEPDTPFFDVSAYQTGNLGPVVAPANGALVIGVIDSGMTSAHPLAAGTIKGTFGTPDALVPGIIGSSRRHDSNRLSHFSFFVSRDSRFNNSGY